MRFGHQIATLAGSEAVATAVRAEQLGFDTILLADHVGDRPRSPMPTLGAMAAATNTIRLGTFVLNNEMRNPVQLAWDATTLDHLSGGRFELGIGAGHSPHEFTETGIELVGAASRKSRLADSVEILRGLLDGETVTHTHGHYDIEAALVGSSVQEHLPILVGGNGAALLGHAGAHADIIGLQGLGKTLEDGHRHNVKWQPEWLDEQIGQIRAGAGERFDELELNALVQAVEITDDRDAAIDEFISRNPYLTRDEIDSTPYAFFGSVEQICDQMLVCQERWGITYFAVRLLDEFAPIIERLSS